MDFREQLGHSGAEIKKKNWTGHWGPLESMMVMWEERQGKWVKFWKAVSWPGDHENTCFEGFKVVVILDVDKVD